ncbi:MAG: HNH endonuclease [bacterium]|nr:HNH endonuclease [bacterium]
MSSQLPRKQEKMLALKSGGRCAFEGCNRYLVEPGTDSDDASIIGQAAHICGEKPGAPRYDQNMTDKERNHESNLIYMCCNHHKIIDDQWNTYTVEYLRELKRKHEERVYSDLQTDMIDVSQTELEAVCDAMIGGSLTPDDDFALISPEQKMSRNELSENIREYVELGTAKAPEVSKYIREEDKLNAGYLDRLTSAFKAEYKRLVKEGLVGDELFIGMMHFAQGNDRDNLREAAGLAVLIYFFEIYDIFEK